MFAHIQNNSVIKTGPRPRWLNDDGDPVSDVVLEQVGWFPVQDADPVPEGKIVAGREVQIVDGLPKWVLTLEDAPPPNANDVDRERDRRIISGTTVVVDGIGPVPLQGRPEDQLNMLALKDTARDLKMAGITDPVIPFRDGENTMHMLTADQMIAATDAGKLHITAIYQAAWSLKDGAEIPDDYQDNKWWPAT